MPRRGCGCKVRRDPACTSKRLAPRSQPAATAFAVPCELHRVSFASSFAIIIRCSLNHRHRVGGPRRHLPGIGIDEYELEAVGQQLPNDGARLGRLPRPERFCVISARRSGTDTGVRLSFGAVAAISSWPHFEMERSGRIRPATAECPSSANVAACPARANAAGIQCACFDSGMAARTRSGVAPPLALRMWPTGSICTPN